MERYGAILSVDFAGKALPLPTGARLSRQAHPQISGGDTDAFPTSVQLSPPLLRAEVTIRDTAAAEALALGAAGALVIVIGPTRSGQASREITLDSAVLTGVELKYEQTALAAATLTFLAESPAGGDPFTAKEVQP